MAIRKLQTNFSSGEIAPDLESRTDLPLYANGVERCRNLRVLPGGGVRRRGGLAHCVTVPVSTYQHNEWIFNSEQTYQLLFSPNRLDILDGVSGLPLVTITVVQGTSDPLPWTLPMIRYLSVYCQGDYAFVVNPHMKPHMVVRTGAATFEVRPYLFDRFVAGSQQPIFQPYHRYAPAGYVIRLISIPATGYNDATGWAPGAQADVSTGFDFFTTAHVGNYLLVSGAQWEIFAVTDARNAKGVLRSDKFVIHLSENALTIAASTTSVKVYDPGHAFASSGSHAVLSDVVSFGLASYDTINGNHVITFADASNWHYNYAPTGPVLNAPVTGGGPNAVYWSPVMQTTEWAEQMYSAVHGYPHCVGGFQQRLILGGGRDAPNRLNFSRLEAPFNFDVGSGADTDSIQIGVSGRRTPTIQAVVGAQHVQVFTSEGEYFIPRIEDQAGLTPATISILPQTFYGSQYGTPALEFDGATLFISRNGRHLRNLVFGEQGYSAASLSFVAHHLLVDPIWLAVQMEDSEQAAATALLVDRNGTVASLTMMRSEKIAAWALHETQGIFQTACAVDSRAFFVSQRTISGNTVMWLEKLELGHLLDGSSFGSYLGRDGQNYRWGGFTRFAGQPINVVVDGLADIGLYTPDGAGTISIPSRANTIEGGLGFTSTLRTLPPELVLPDGPTPGEPRRVVCAALQVHNTLGMKVRSTKLLNTRAEADLGLPAQPISGRVHVYMLGWDDRGQIEVSQSGNGPFTLLSANLDVEF